MLIPVHFLPFIFSPEFVAPIEFLMLTCLFAKNNFSGQVKPFRKQRSKLGKRTRPPCFLAMNEKLKPRGRSVLLSLLRAIFMDHVIVKRSTCIKAQLIGLTHDSCVFVYVNRNYDSDGFVFDSAIRNNDAYPVSQFVNSTRATYSACKKILW